MQVHEDIFQGYGIEVALKEADDFLKVRETLTRMGVSSRDGKTLVQSCHILHKRGRYAILHFKELFALDGRMSNISDDDYARRDTIIRLLRDWNLLKLIDDQDVSDSVAQLRIIPFKQKETVNLVSKYSIGKKDHVKY